MKHLVLATAALLLCVGCSTSARYVNPHAGQGVTTVGDINTQDWGTAADQMIQSLLRREDLAAADGRRMVVMVGRIRNATGTRIDTDLLTKKIRVALLNSGKFVITTAVGLDGPEDPASMALTELRESEEFDQSTVAGKGEKIAPDYSLSGKIIELNARSGRTRQATYTFQLSMTDIRTGLAFWEDEREITKMGRRPSVSW